MAAHWCAEIERKKHWFCINIDRLTKWSKPAGGNIKVVSLVPFLTVPSEINPCYSPAVGSVWIWSLCTWSSWNTHKHNKSVGCFFWWCFYFSTNIHHEKNKIILHQFLAKSGYKQVFRMFIQPHTLTVSNSLVIHTFRGKYRMTWGICCWLLNADNIMMMIFLLSTSSSCHDKILREKITDTCNAKPTKNT